MNLLYWVIWAWLATHTKNGCITLEKLLAFISRQKINFILNFFFEMLQRYCKLIVWSSLGMSTYVHSNDIINVQKSFVLFYKEKINFIPHLEIFLRRFFKDMQTYFGYFGHTWLHTPNQMVEVFNVYLHAENKFHRSFLSWDITISRILQFDWQTPFWSITRNPEFYQIWN